MKGSNMTRSSPSRASAQPRRQPLGSRQRIRVKVPEGDGYKYRIANNAADGGNRVENLLDQGYEVVPQVERTGDRRVDEASAIGSASSNINLGRQDKGTLMRIKDEWYEQDQVSKHAQADSLEQRMKDSVRQAADYGKFTVEVEK
jgi:hypothetical protein